MKMNKNLILAGTALTALFAANVAMAQSTATQEVEVVIKGTRKGVGPIEKESGIKSKTTIDQDYISKLPAGQNVTAALNVVPGYFYENNDPFGSSGGTVHIRGIGSDRISLTFDGIQLNDAGNYAIYPNQQLDGELIQSASVSTGGTDVDSMSASAAGGTINYTTIKPADKFGVLVNLSGGSDNFKRGFVKLDTGKFGPWGTSAFFAMSDQSYDTFTTDNGKLNKNQYNFRIYQPMGDDGSFMSLSGNYNRNRNRFIFNQTMANFALHGNRYGSAGLTNINPSNTGNLRGQSKWVINDKLFLTVDPAYQYVLANGGGSSSLNEKTGKIGSWTNPQFVNYDANHDGTLGTDSIYNPNTTQTDRFSVTSSLVWTIADGDVLRFGVSLDRGRTKQTGDGVFLNADGTTPNPFGAKNEKSLYILGKDGTPYARRDRFSDANVDVFSVEYRGHYFDDKLFLDLGLRSQKMERKLHQYCYSKAEDGSGSFQPFCTTAAPDSTNANGTVNYAVNSGSTWIKPFNADVTFKKVLPKLGLTYKVTDTSHVFADYSEAMSSPKTDDYYAITLNSSNVITLANPNPELTKTGEVGYRYATSKLTASAVVWKTRFNNRIVSTYDPTSDTYQDRNIGSVDLQGIEGAVAYQAASTVSLWGNVSFLHSKVLNDESFGNFLSTSPVTPGQPDILPIKGKEVVDTPDTMVNAGIDWKMLSTLDFHFAAKYVGDRWSTDMNDEKAKAFTTADFTLRYDLGSALPLTQHSYLQLNGSNIFNARYFTTGSGTQATINPAFVDPTGKKTLAATPSYYRGAPTTYMMTLSTQF